MSNDVLVFAEHFQNRLTEITFEMLGKGRELAAARGAKLLVILAGSGVKNLAAELGSADGVFLADSPSFQGLDPESSAALIAKLVGEIQPRLVMLGSTTIGLDILSLLAAKTGLPCLDNCIRLDTRNDHLLATCQTYGGKLFAEISLPTATTIVAVVPSSWSPDQGKVSGSPALTTVPLPDPPTPSRIIFRRVIEPPPGDVDITKEAILVAVGRGIQNADNLSLAEELASTLGGAVSGSRPIIDQGWLPLTRQVGKSGMTVKPKLYLALGISGAPEHQEGMKNSELIIAVNTDPRAPIFGVAHFGAVADLFDVVPALTGEIKRRRN